MKQLRMVGGLALLAFAALGCGGCPWLRAEDPSKSIRAYIVHHSQDGFREIAREFHKETGIRARIGFACRRGLYEVVKSNHDGDIAISSKRSVLEQLNKDGLGEGELIAVGSLVPVIEVVKGNPKKIWTLADLARPGLRVALPKAPGCMAKVADAILKKNALTKRVERNVVKRVRGHGAVAASVDGREVDATIIWAWAMKETGRTDLQAVPIPPGQNVIDPLEALVLNTGQNRQGAERFAAFLQGERARAILARVGLRDVR